MKIIDEYIKLPIFLVNETKIITIVIRYYNNSINYFNKINIKLINFAKLGGPGHPSPGSGGPVVSESYCRV